MCGHFVLYKYVNYTHKNEFRKYLKTNSHNIEEIEINPSLLFVNSGTILWKDGNKEIEIGGEMYDIVGIKNKGTKVVLCIVMDKAEKQQFEKFKKQSGSIYGNESRNKQDVVKDFLSLKVTFNSSSKTFFVFSNSDISFSEPSSKICFGFIGIQTPPPII